MKNRVFNLLTVLAIVAVVFINLKVVNKSTKYGYLKPEIKKVLAESSEESGSSGSGSGSGGSGRSCACEVYEGIIRVFSCAAGDSKCEARYKNTTLTCYNANAQKGC